MLKVINKTKREEYKNGKTLKITEGFCEKCGTEVSKSQYGEDEDCPVCQDWLDWMGGNWLKDRKENDYAGSMEENI